MQVDVCGFQLASKTPFRSAFEAVQLLTKVSLKLQSLMTNVSDIHSNPLTQSSLLLFFVPHSPLLSDCCLKELELYKEELLSKPALLVVNKMDLPDAEDKLAELKEQLQNPEG